MKLRQPKLLKVIFAVTFLLSLKSHAGFADKESRFLFQAGMYTFSTSSTNSSASVSGFGAYSFGFEYCMLDQFSIIASYNYLKSSGVGGDTSVGVDLAAKYYPITYSGYKTYTNGPLDVKLTQLWRPYLGFGLRQREFVLILTTNYYGYGIFAGADYQFAEKYYLNLELREDFYSGGSSDSKATMMNLLFGIGYQF